MSNMTIMICIQESAYRRARGDMIQLYKHFHIYDKATLSRSFQPQIRNSRRHDFQLIWHRPKDGIYGLQTNSFYYRAAQVWNNLPVEVVNATSINAFKNLLDKAWANEPIKFNLLRNKHTIGNRKKDVGLV